MFLPYSLHLNKPKLYDQLNNSPRLESFTSLSDFKIPRSSRFLFMQIQVSTTTLLSADRWFLTEWIFPQIGGSNFLCRIVSDDKHQTETHSTPPYSLLSHSIFHEDLNSFFMRLGFIVVIPLKKSVDFSWNEWMIKRVSQSVECLWKEKKYVAGDEIFVIVDETFDERQ